MDIFKRFFTLAAGGAFIFLLFLQTEKTTAAVAEGVTLFSSTLLPSLFPFSIAAVFLSLCGALKYLSPLFSPVFRLLGIPRQVCPIWLASFLGGYPSGAQIISTLHSTGKLKKEAAETLGGCMINPGPAFLTVAIGKSLFGSMETGYMLLLSGAISSLLLCAVYCRSKHFSDKAFCGGNSQSVPLDFAFVTAVQNSGSAMLSICFFVTAFSVIISLLQSAMPFLFAMLPLLEVTLGCKMYAASGIKNSITICAFLLGFGGFSVCFQSLCILKNGGLTPVFFWKKRLVAGVLNALAAHIMLLFGFGERAVSASAAIYADAPTAVLGADRLLGGICLAAMMVISLQKLEPVRKDGI